MLIYYVCPIQSTPNMWHTEVSKGVGGNTGDKLLPLTGEFFLSCLGVFITVSIISSILTIPPENKTNYIKILLTSILFMRYISFS